MNSVMHPDDECRPVGAQHPPFAVGQEVWVRGIVSHLTSEGVVVKCKDVNFDSGATVHAPVSSLRP